MGDIHHVHNYYLSKESSNDETDVIDEGPRFPLNQAALAVILILLLYFGYGYAKQKGLLETVPPTKDRLIMEVPQPTKKVKLRSQPTTDLERQNAELEKERKRFYANH